MENTINLHRVGDVGANNQVILQFWDFRKQEWNYFPARRTAPVKDMDGVSEYITSSGKTGRFYEKPLTPDECKKHETATAEKVSKYPWRDCKQSRDYCQRMLDAGMDKDEIKKSLCALFPLTPAKTAEKTNVFDSLM